MADLLKDILPAQAMGIEVSRHWKHGIELSAPLDKNLNDKGTGFAGSLSSILTLAGWSLITQTLNEAGISADVMVVKTETEFRAPVTTDFKSVCVTTDEEVRRIFQSLENDGRGRIVLRSEIPDCARMTASYAIKLKPSGA